ncbi:MAG: PAS domain S-box protein, partial [bacterium]|nr:PAS domain S-box protein [bacterium]
MSMINRLQRLQSLNLLQQELLCDGGLYKDIKKITDGVLEIFNADFCRIWIKGPGDLCEKGCVHAMAKDPEKLCRKREFCLHLISSSGRYTHIDGPHSRMPFGLYKIGRVANGQTSKFLTNDAVNDPQIMDHEWARGLSLVSFAGYKLQDTNGEPIGVLALFSKQTITPEEDAMLEGIAGITAHVIQTAKVEEELKMERDKLRNIMESMGDGVYIVNQTYDIEYVNPVIEREFGPAKGRKCYEYFYERDEVCPWCKNKEVFAGKTVRWEGYSVKTNKTYERIATPLRNYDGSISKLEIVHDVTERKRAEQELALFRALLDRSNDAIEVVDPETGRFLDMNEKALLDLNYSREELPFLRVWDID